MMVTVNEHTRKVNGKVVPVRKHTRDLDLPEGMSNAEINKLEAKKVVRDENNFQKTKSFDGQGLIGWELTAKKELEEKLDGLHLVSQDGSGSNGEREWVIFENEASARDAAIFKVEEDLEDSPELFSQNFIQQYIFIDDVAKHEMALQEQNSLMDEGEGEDRLKEEAKYRNISYNSIDDLKEKLGDSIYDSYYVELDDPVNYFVDEQGIYTVAELMNQYWIQIKEKDAARDSVDSDGAGHFLDGYDGQSEELKSGAVAFGTN